MVTGGTYVLPLMNDNENLLTNLASIAALTRLRINIDLGPLAF